MQSNTKRRLLLTFTVALLMLIGGYLFLGSETVAIKERTHQVSDLLLACKMYALQHGDTLPKDLRELSPVYSNYPAFFQRALNEIELVSPGISETNSSDAVVLREKTPDRRGRRVVGYLGGQTVVRSE